MMTRLHLTDDQFSRLIDGAAGDGDRRLLEAHVRSCRDCFDAYQDALRYRAIWQADPAIFIAPFHMVAIAHETPVRNDRAVAGSHQTPQRAHRRLPAWAAAFAGAAAVVALVAALAVFQPDLFTRSGAEYAHLVVPVRAAVEEASAGGAIMLPGVEAMAALTEPAYRSGTASPDPAVTRALGDLAEMYRDASTPPEIAHWLISGFLAVGEVETARLYVEDARRRYPGNSGFVVLEAIVAYRTNDIRRAERLLHMALDADPRSGAALLNLSLVQYEQGHTALARQTLERVRSQFAGTPLEVRATALLEGLLGG